MTTYSDAHCHLHLPRLRPQLDAILQRYASALFLSAAADDSDWPLLASWSAAYRERFPAGRFMYCLGYHPQEAQRLSAPSAREQALAALEAALGQAEPEAAAIGEIGLDKLLISALPAAARTAAQQAQLELLYGQLKLAQRYGLPAVLHDVRSHGALLAALKEIPPPAALLHGFYGGAQVLRGFISLKLRRGLYISPNAALLERAFVRPGPELCTEPRQGTVGGLFQDARTEPEHKAAAEKARERERQRWRELAGIWPRERFLLESDSCLRADGSPTPPRDTAELAAVWGALWDMSADEVQALAAENLRGFIRASTGI